MPTYEYRCRDCGQHIEVVQSFTDEPLTVCGVCSGSLRKVFSPIGISFKGSGFYRTDSRTSGGRAKSEAKAEAKSESTSDTKSDTKSESGSKKEGSSSSTAEAKSA